MSALVDAQDNGLFEPSGDAVENTVVRDGFVRQAATIARAAHDKMSFDSAPSGRLASTLQLLRACRMFDHRLVGQMSIEAILAESEHLLALPSASAAAGAGLDAIRGEASEYRNLAKSALQEGRVDGLESIADFWNRLEWAPSIKTWYTLSRQVLLIMPSSAAVERVFSVLTQGISATQQNALPDYQLYQTQLKHHRKLPEPPMGVFLALEFNN